MYVCSQICKFSFQHHAQFMCEIWRGEKFSFLSQPWYKIDMLEEILCFGYCSCIGFNAIQLASYAQNINSIKQLKQLGCCESDYKFSRLKRTPLPSDAIHLDFFDRHAHLSEESIEIVAQIECGEHVLSEIPGVIGLLYKQVSEHEEYENIAECLEVLLETKFNRECHSKASFLGKHCSCNVFAHALEARNLHASVYKVLAEKAILPEFEFIIGGDDIGISQYSFTHTEQSRIFTHIFYDAQKQKYVMVLWFEFAHEVQLNRRVFVENENDLQSLLCNENVQTILCMLGFVYPKPVFTVKNDQAQQLLNQLSSIHEYFRKMKSLSELTRQVINQSVVTPYTKHVTSLNLPQILCDFIRLK